MWLEILIFVLFLVLYDFVWFKRRPQKFPPGPPRWPIVGNLFDVGLGPHKSVLEMKKKYGDIIGLYLGGKRAVFINSFEHLKEAFNLPALNGRPEMPFMAVQETGIYRGISLTIGKTWTEQRRFAFSYLGSGMRNNVPMESLVLHEANELIKDLKEKCGRSISTGHVFTIPTINSLWSIITGEKYSVKDPKILKVVEHTDKFVASAGVQGIYLYFPKLSKRFPKISGYEYLMANINPGLKFIEEIINKHKETYQEGVQRDFVDCYLEKIQNTTDKNSSFYGKTGEENLQFSLYNLYLGGSETVSTTLRWLIFLMAHHPDIQEKLYNTISNILKPGQIPSLKDQPELPLVKALIMEVMRYSSVAPLSIFHEATEDVKFREYFIPKGTLVIANLYGIAHDPEVWGDPEIFRPDRFLIDDGRKVIEHPAMFPFSCGRRVCPGESLAKDQLFLFTVRLFQSFKVEFDPNEPSPPLKYTTGWSLAPVHHKVVFTMRDLNV